MCGLRRSARNMPQYLCLLILVALPSCTSVPEVAISRELGHHQLPYRPNQSFVLTEIEEAPRRTIFDPPISISYYLDGHRRRFRFAEPGTTDGYVTYLGRLLAAEIEGVESPIMDEQVIRLQSGEEI